MTLKGLCLNTIVHRKDAENAEYTLFLFSFEWKENKKHKPYENTVFFK